MRFGILWLMLFSMPTWASFPMTVTDAGGTEITLNQPPLSVSSKTLFSDEVLLDLISDNRFTSVTNLVDDPNFSAIAGKMPPSIPRLDLNVERILVNRPDIVFAANWSDSGKITQLRNAGIKVFLLPTPETLDDIQSLITLVGSMLGEEDKAEALVMEMDRKLEQGIVTTQKYRVVDYNSWGTSSTRHSSWQLIVEQAGFENAVADFQSDKYGQTPMSKELLVTLNPDVLFLPGWIYGDDAAADNFREQVVSDRSLQNITAIEQGNVFQIPEYLRGTYSHYIVDAILYVNHAVIGEAAP